MASCEIANDGLPSYFMNTPATYEDLVKFQSQGYHLLIRHEAYSTPLTGYIRRFSPNRELIEFGGEWGGGVWMEVHTVVVLDLIDEPKPMEPKAALATDQTEAFMTYMLKNGVPITEPPTRWQRIKKLLKRL